MKKKILTFLYAIFSVLCILYGIMIAAIHSGSKFYLVWLALGCFFLILSFGVSHHLFTYIPPLLKKICFGGILLLFSLFLFTEALIFTGFFEKGEEGYDYLIVLGAQVHKNGPSIVLKRRLECAEDYLKRNPDTICIVSGGQGANEPFSEAFGMADYLISHGISADRIFLEDQSLNTIQNIRYSMAYIENPTARVGIVTNGFHVFRGTSIAKKQGLVNAHGIAADSHPLYLPNNLFREFFGVMKDFLCGNM